MFKELFFSGKVEESDYDHLKFLIYVFMHIYVYKLYEYFLPKKSPPRWWNTYIKNEVAGQGSVSFDLQTQDRFHQVSIRNLYRMKKILK